MKDVGSVVAVVAVAGGGVHEPTISESQMVLGPLDEGRDEDRGGGGGVDLETLSA